MKGMILAAGYGERLWPLTADRTKPALPVLGVDFGAAVERKRVLALGANDPLLVTPQRIGHRPGGNDERLGHEAAQHQHQDDDENDGLDDLAEAIRRRVGAVGGRRRAGAARPT